MNRSFFEISSSMDQFVRGLETDSFQGLKKRFKEWKRILHQFKLFLAGLPHDIRKNETVLRFKREMEIHEKKINDSFKKINALHANYRLSFQARMQAMRVPLQGVKDEVLQISERFGAIRGNIQKWVEGRKWLATRHQFQWGRKFFHVANSLFGLWLYVFSGFDDRIVLAVLGAYLGFNIAAEIARKYSPAFNGWICRSFSWMMRENEINKISSATWYLGSIFFVMLLFPKPIVVLCVLFVAFGDTLAGIIGVNWGKHKIGTHGSVEGFLAGFAACFVSTLLFITYWLPHITLTGLPLVGFSFLAALIGAISEMAFKKLDDNLMIPLLSAPALLALMKCFGQ